MQPNTRSKCQQPPQNKIHVFFDQTLLFATTCLLSEKHVLEYLTELAGKRTL